MKTLALTSIVLLIVSMGCASSPLKNARTVSESKPFNAPEVAFQKSEGKSSPLGALELNEKSATVRIGSVIAPFAVVQINKSANILIVENDNQGLSSFKVSVLIPKVFMKTVNGAHEIEPEKIEYKSTLGACLHATYSYKLAQFSKNEMTVLIASYVKDPEKSFGYLRSDNPIFRGSRFLAMCEPNEVFANHFGKFKVSTK